MSERYDFDLMKQLMAKDNGGEWVRYSDYAALKAQLAEKEVEVERLRNMLNGYGKLDAELAIAERRIEALSRTGAVKVKALDLSNLLRHAFFEGFMVAGGSQEAAAEWWPEYDPETCAAYSRILSALEPAAPEGQQEPMPRNVIWFGFDENTGEFTGEYCSVKPADARGMRPYIPYTARPSEQAVTEAWRPIETAPMDGTCILAAVDWLVHPVILFWNAHHDMRCWESPSSGVPYYVKNLGGWQPTHWMPLPTPPVNQSEGAGE